MLNLTFFFLQYSHGWVSVYDLQWWIYIVKLWMCASSFLHFHSVWRKICRIIGWRLSLDWHLRQANPGSSPGLWLQSRHYDPNWPEHSKSKPDSVRFIGEVRRRWKVVVVSLDQKVAFKHSATPLQGIPIQKHRPLTGACALKRDVS